MTVYDLVFEGGGAKGTVFVGALQAFDEKGHDFDRLLGTSAGAITATLLAAGYGVQELLDALNERVGDQSIFAEFMGTPQPFAEAELLHSATLKLLEDIDIPLIPNRIEGKIDAWLADLLMRRAANLFSLIERGGWYSADKFIVWMKEKLNTDSPDGKVRNYGDMNLKQFYEATQQELSVVTSDTVGERMLVLNHRTAPDLPVVWAVRMSMSIPLLWPEVEWQPEWGQYHMGGQVKDMTDHKMVDGALLSNFPIELFLSDEPYVTAVMGEKTSDHVLGFMIDENLPVEGVETATPETEDNVDVSQLRIIQRIQRLINTATSAHDKMVVEMVENMVVRLPAKGFGLTEFDMEPDKREKLITAGYRAMEAYLDDQEAALLDPAFDFSVSEEVAPTKETHANHVAGRMLGL